jgi:hypothetical protein
MLPIAQLMEEELDRGNTTKEELARWLEKYGLTPESPATWVTTNPFYAAGYENEMRPPDVDSYIEEQGEDAFEEEFEVSWTAKHPTFTKQGGVLVVESHDGDDGYLFVSPRKNPPRTQPYKYGVPKKYLQGLPDKVARERATEIIRRREEGIKTSSSLPGDKLTRKKTMRGSKWTKMYKQKYGANSGTTRSVVARDTGIPASIINEVYKRGVGASRTSGHRPGANDSSWALARVHAFVMKVLHEKGPINQDPDLARKVMARKNPPFKTPPYMRRCVVHLVEDGHDLNAAFAICNASMQDAGHLTGGNGQKETKSGKRKRRADRGEKDQAAFDVAYEEILAMSRARNNPKLSLRNYGDEVIEVVDADRIGKGMFKTVFKSKKPRKDGQDVVAITSDGSFDHEILSYACDRSPKSRHIPCTKFVGYIDDQRVYTMQLYKSPLRKTDSPKAWEQYKMLKEASEKAARKHRSRNPDMALDEYRATIENYKKMPGHSKAIARALDYIEDASANYGTSFLWEFTPRNLATDKSGNLILLDAFFDVRQAMKIRDARMKKARGW